MNTSRAITVYLHGGSVADIWHFDAGPGLAYADYASTLARAGDTSLVFNNLGYGQSDIPNGNEVCDGSWADMAHQVAADLRDGDYQVEGATPLEFDRVVLAGISGGGRIAEVTAYSFPRDIDALVVAGWADQADANAIPNAAAKGVPAAEWGLTCTSNGEAKQGGKSGGGYAYLYGPADIGVLLYNADPRIVAAFSDATERDLCGDAHSIGTAIMVDQAFVPTISVPVLLAYGDHDLFFGPVSAAVQRERYAGSHDVSLAIIPDAGHLVMLQRTAPAFASVMRGWLGARGF